MSLVIQQLEYIDSAQLFNEVADQPWAIFLDSGCFDANRSATRFADYDVLAIRPITTVVTQGETTVIDVNGEKTDTQLEPMAVIKSQLDNLDWQVENREEGQQGKQDLPYLPGALGYFSYDLGRRYEAMPNLAKNDEALPETAIGIYPVVVVVDHKQQQIQLIAIDNEQAQETIELWKQIHKKALHQELQVNTKQRLKTRKVIESINRDAYQQKFDAVRQYTIEGDCYQVNLTKQFCCEVQADAWQTYLHLRQISPAPYGAFMNFPFAQVLSNSPESFIQCRNRQVVTRPIKGTRPRIHNDKQADLKLAKELENSTKDQAENLMIVDLMRNDLSRCCEIGSVKTPQLFALHSFANVHHLISTVTGRLKHVLHPLDLLRSCFPGGSITGAPKIRAMEIIEELEPVRRGLYCGSVAYIGIDQSLETNIAIRTMVVKDGQARFAAGGGLVIDSGEEQEYQEINHKAKMLASVLGIETD